MLPAHANTPSTTRIREHSGNAQGRFFNTVTAAMWKGEGISRWGVSGSADASENGVAQEVVSREVGETDGFPFHANAVNGENPTHALVQENRQPIDIEERTLRQSEVSTPGPAELLNGREITEGITASGRLSIQFAPYSTTPDANSPARGSPALAPSDRPVHQRSTSLISKIKSMTPLHHTRSQSGFFNQGVAIVDNDQSSGPGPSNRLRNARQIRPRSYGDGDVDADADDSGGDDISTPLPAKRKLKTRRPFINGSTPADDVTEEREFAPISTPSGVRSRARLTARRAATTSDVGDGTRQGVSEDEGRERLARNAGWRRRSSAWLHAAQNSTTSSPRRQSGPDLTEDSRPKTRRFFSTMAGGASPADSTGVQKRPVNDARAREKWQKFRSSLKLMVQKTKEDRINEAKSAELMAELLAGSPAALILASSFQRDDGDKKRIPVLLEQLKISITKSGPVKDDSGGDRHLLFHMDLEYGSGLMRMKWSVDRTLRDFINLHLKYKLQSGTTRSLGRRPGEDAARSKLPRFPKSAFPILRGVRGLADDDEEDDDTADEPDGADDAPGAAGRPAKLKRRTSSQRRDRRQSSVDDRGDGGRPSLPNRTGTMSEATNAFSTAKENYNGRQRKKLEIYLRDMIRFVTFRAGSNRLCRFLELSALGVRLASESTFHGKEGSLVLQSGKGLDFRKQWKPSLLIQRHKPMWFLVRQSYLVYVDSPEEMNVYDVFLIDSEFDVQSKRPRLRDQKNVQDLTRTAKTQARHPQHHVLRLQNAERKIKLLAKNERQLQQFQESLQFVRATTDWAKKNRFGSFAPVRKNVFAQWLVDGRDYMWNLSRAISMAQDVIYIHDWWLSPEIYTRRPAAISHKWRLDRLLKRKAEEGVKIFVIVYRNINSAIPIDSEYTKFSLLELHPNVFVQRSPNQFRQNTFFWAHHEKICIVDHTIAFCGGVDLCYGRWDTPQHSVVDDKPTGFEPSDLPRDSDHCQLFAGKDYSNPRVLDFFKLDEPYGEMYDRTKVPRMPWHDIGMQIVGQPARDLTRHFTQRWNYILRQRKTSRPTPFLLPPPDFGPGELEALGLEGTCEIQMLRSACDWSLGTPKLEHSIMTAYCKLIQASDHFVYIENQFFISSCEVEGTKIRNAIGDALVHRIVAAHHARTPWRAVILIPLMPGFQNTVEAPDGSSIRLIMQCQYRSIDRGESSIFGRLRSLGIEPEDYIQFYSLRSWGKIGPTKALVTEQLYIHAKCMVVDDRYAIIGSANINERSMLGDRDSEVAAVIADTDMIDSYMAGKHYRVGRFPHTLRMRLMREHLGVDVDEVMAEERDDGFFDGEEALNEEEGARPTTAQSDRSTERKLIAAKHKTQDDLIARAEQMHSFNHDSDWAQANNPKLKTNKKLTSDPRITGNKEHTAEVDGFGPDNMAEVAGSAAARGRDTVLLSHDREVLVSNLSPEGKGTLKAPVPLNANHKKVSRSGSQDDDDSMSTIAVLPPARPPRLQTRELGLTLLSQLPPLPIGDDTDIGGPPLQRTFTDASAETFNPLLATMRRPVIDKDCMRDPLNDSFFYDTWHTVAQNNTKIFRQVFRCMPDTQVTNWKEYEAAIDYAERFAQSQGMAKSNMKMQQESHGKTGPPGHGASVISQPLAGVKTKIENASATADGTQSDLGHKLMAAIDRKREDHQRRDEDHVSEEQHIDYTKEVREKDYSLNEKERVRSSENTRVDFAAVPKKDQGESLNEKTPIPNGDAQHENQHAGSRRRRRATTKSSMHGPDHMPSKEEAEELLKLVQGHLIEWPYDWLVQEERGGKWLYSVDQMAPLEIYN